MDLAEIWPQFLPGKGHPASSLIKSWSAVRFRTKTEKNRKQQSENMRPKSSPGKRSVMILLNAFSGWHTRFSTCDSICNDNDTYRNNHECAWLQCFLMARCTWHAVCVTV